MFERMFLLNTNISQIIHKYKTDANSIIKHTVNLTLIQKITLLVHFILIVKVRNCIRGKRKLYVLFPGQQRVS